MVHSCCPKPAGCRLILEKAEHQPFLLIYSRILCPCLDVQVSSSMEMNGAWARISLTISAIPLLLVNCFLLLLRNVIPKFQNFLKKCTNSYSWMMAIFQMLLLQIRLVWANYPFEISCGRTPEEWLHGKIFFLFFFIRTVWNHTSSFPISF